MAELTRQPATVLGKHPRESTEDGDGEDNPPKPKKVCLNQKYFYNDKNIINFIPIDEIAQQSIIIIDNEDNSYYVPFLDVISKSPVLSVMFTNGMIETHERRLKVDLNSKIIQIFLNYLVQVGPKLEDDKEVVPASFWCKFHETSLLDFIPIALMYDLDCITEIYESLFKRGSFSGNWVTKALEIQELDSNYTLIDFVVSNYIDNFNHTILTDLEVIPEVFWETVSNAMMKACWVAQIKRDVFVRKLIYYPNFTSDQLSSWGLFHPYRHNQPDEVFLNSVKLISEDYYLKLNIIHQQFIIVKVVDRF